MALQRRECAWRWSLPLRDSFGDPARASSESPTGNRRRSFPPPLLNREGLLHNLSENLLAMHLLPVHQPNRLFSQHGNGTPQPILANRITATIIMIAPTVIVRSRITRSRQGLHPGWHSSARIETMAMYDRVRRDCSEPRAAATWGAGAPCVIAADEGPSGTSNYAPNCKKQRVELLQLPERGNGMVV